jgi:hypothetical protein
MKRTANETWMEASWDDVCDVRYGSPFRAANGLLIASFNPMTD